MIDDKIAQRIDDGIDGQMPAAMEEGACQAVKWAVREMRWEFRHVIDGCDAVTWGDVAPMICSRLAGMAPAHRLMGAVRFAISPLTLDDPVTA